MHAVGFRVDVRAELQRAHGVLGAVLGQRYNRIGSGASPKSDAKANRGSSVSTSNRTNRRQLFTKRECMASGNFTLGLASGKWAHNHPLKIRRED